MRPPPTSSSSGSSWPAGCSCPSSFPASRCLPSRVPGSTESTRRSTSRSRTSISRGGPGAAGGLDRGASQALRPEPAREDRPRRLRLRPLRAIIPGVDRTSVQIFVGAAVLIVIDSLLGLRTARRSGGASSIAWSLVWLAVANETIVALGRLTRGDEQLALGNTIFFVGLLTLIVTLYDRYEPYRGVRLEESPQGAWV